MVYVQEAFITHYNIFFILITLSTINCDRLALGTLPKQYICYKL